MVEICHFLKRTSSKMLSIFLVLAILMLSAEMSGSVPSREVDQNYTDPEEDEYYLHLVDRNGFREEYGTRGDQPSMDLVFLGSSMMGNDLHVELGVSSHISSYPEYHVYIVDTEHYPDGALSHPENISDGADYEICDVDHVLFHVEMEFDMFGDCDINSEPPIGDIIAEADDDMIHLDIPMDGIDGFLEEDWGLYAVSHFSGTLITSEMREEYVKWDSIGLGAGDAPAEFNTYLRDPPVGDVVVTFDGIDCLTLEIDHEETGLSFEILKSMVDSNGDGIVSDGEMDTYERIAEGTSYGDGIDVGVYMNGKGASLKMEDYELDLIGNEGFTVHQVIECRFEEVETRIENHTLELSIINMRSDLLFYPPRGFDVCGCRGMETHCREGDIYRFTTRETRAPVVELNLTGKTGQDGGSGSDSLLVIILVAAVTSILILLVVVLISRKWIIHVSNKNG